MSAAAAAPPSKEPGLGVERIRRSIEEAKSKVWHRIVFGPASCDTFHIAIVGRRADESADAFAVRVRAEELHAVYDVYQFACAEKRPERAAVMKAYLDAADPDYVKKAELSMRAFVDALKGTEEEWREAVHHGVSPV